VSWGSDCPCAGPPHVQTSDGGRARIRRDAEFPQVEWRRVVKGAHLGYSAIGLSKVS